MDQKNIYLWRLVFNWPGENHIYSEEFYAFTQNKYTDNLYDFDDQIS